MTDKKSILIKEFFSKVRLANIEHTKKDSIDKLINNQPQNELTATGLGKHRLDIKKHLAAEMKEIDGLVNWVVG